MSTARGDFSMAGMPDVHIFEYLMSGLREQTFKDFEVVITDVDYERRKNYFIEHPEEFPITHVPPKENVWLPKNYPAVSTCKNTGILNSKGEIIIFTGDCSTFSKKYIDQVVYKIKKGTVITTTYNNSLGDKVLFKDARKESIIQYTYGNVCYHIDDLIDLNGYEELFDGSVGLEDTNLGFRANNRRKRILLITVPVLYQQHRVRYVFKEQRAPRCMRMVEKLLYGKYKNVFRANSIKITDEDIETLLSCNELFDLDHKCPICGFPCRGYAFNKQFNEEDINLYRDLNFDLKKERELNAS